MQTHPLNPAASGFRNPRQLGTFTNSCAEPFYGYTKLIALRKETEAALGSKFNQKKFHDFILMQGLLPPDLMEKAVMQEFIPAR